MSKMIFVNLPVSDLKASTAFYEELGFKNNAQFTDETAACMVWSEAIQVMLLTHEKWRSFTTRPIADLDGHVWGMMWMDMSAMSSTKEEVS